MAQLTLKQKMQKNVVFGTWCYIPNEIVSNVIGRAGLDFIIVDMEHGAMDFEKAFNMTVSAQCEGMSSIIRVPWNDPSYIQRALELGPDGIIVPNIETVAELEKVIRAAKYPPIGNRGFSPYTRSGSYQSASDHTQRENSSRLLAIMVEGETGLSNLEKFLSYKEIDIVYIGSYDISCRLGTPGQIKHPRVLEILKKSVQMIKKAGKSAGCMGNTIQDIKELKEMGFDFILYGVDVHYLYQAYQELSKLRR